MLRPPGYGPHPAHDSSPLPAKPEHAIDKDIPEGNTVIVAPSGHILAGPVRQREETLVADLDLGDVLAARRQLDPVGRYHRPDIFRLQVDTSPRPPVTQTCLPGGGPAPTEYPAERAGQQ
jgi:hypothetical protein